MSMLDRKLWRDLWHARGQVVTIALVVASGIAAFSASLSTYESLKRMQAEYYESARFAHVFAVARRVPSSIAPRMLELPGVAEVAATLSYDVLLDLPGVVEPMIGRIIALPEHGLPAMNRLTLMAGRWIDAPESNQVLVNQTFADKRGLKPGSTLQALLNGKRERLEVVGIVLSPEYIFPAAHGVGDDASFGILWIGRKRLAAAFNMEGAFNRVALRLAHGASEEATIDQLDRLLETYGSTGAYGRAEQPSHKAITQEIAEQRVFGLVLPSVFLGVAMFLLNVVLTRQIGTQRGQIAVLKALGYGNARIGLHYLQFVLVIVALGIVVGLAAGAWLGRLLTELYAEFFHFPSLDFAMPAWIVLGGTLAALVAAVAGALQALRRVVRLAPAAAMLPPTPPTFRSTLGERLGFGRLYSPAVRMILRDMERRPGRALATTLGIAGAVAILISGTWWRDAIDYLFEVEFRMRERQDISLVLAEPASTTVVHDLLRLPGVMRAEIDRSAPVRLSHGHRSYRTTLTGLASGATLRLLLDDNLRDVPLPDDGLVINRTLADLLDVRSGRQHPGRDPAGRAHDTRRSPGGAGRRPDGNPGLHAPRCAEPLARRRRRHVRGTAAAGCSRTRTLSAADQGNAARGLCGRDRSDHPQLPRNVGAQHPDLHQRTQRSRRHHRGRCRLQQRAHRAGRARLGSGEPAGARHDACRGLGAAAG